MSEVKVNNGNIEDALKRFKRQCARNGVLQEVRKREHYEKPSVKRKKKSEAARKRKYLIFSSFRLLTKYIKNILFSSLFYIFLIIFYFYKIFD